MSVAVAAPQAKLSVLEFIQERGYEIDKLYVDAFWSSVSDDQWLYIGTEMLKWMGYQTERARRAKDLYVKLLVKSFKSDEDYKQLNASELGSFYVPTSGDIEPDSHNKVKHLLVSPDCFKLSLMMMKTDKAHKIRMYYISLEKIVKAYVKYEADLVRHNHELALRETLRLQQKVDEMAALQADLSKMAINSTPVAYTEYVYILTSRRYYQLNLFKIGKTENLSKRLSSFNTGNALEMDEQFYLCSIPTSDSRGLEKQLHRLLEPFRMKREWYKIHASDLISLLRHVSRQQADLLAHTNYLIANQSVPKDPIRIDQFGDLVTAGDADPVTTETDLVPAETLSGDNEGKQFLLHIHREMVRANETAKMYKKDALYATYAKWAQQTQPCAALVKMLRDLGFTDACHKVKQSDGSRKSVRAFKFKLSMLERLNLV